MDKKGRMVIVGIILAYAVYQMNKAFYLDGDIMWHYKTGGYILSHLSVPKHDIFSWQPNLTWMPHEWLHDVYLYLFYSTFGIWAARILLVASIAAPIFIGYNYNKENIVDIYGFLIYIGVIKLIEASSFCVRPSEVSTLILVMATVLIIDEKKHKDIIYFILTVLFVNIHGGAIASMLIIPVLCMFADLVIFLVTKEKMDVKANLKILLIAFLGSLINPQGIFIYKYTTNVFFNSYIKDNILEYKPLNLNLAAAVAILGIMLCFGASKKFRELKKEDIRKYAVMLAFLSGGIAVRRMIYPAYCFLAIFGFQYFQEYLISLNILDKDHTILQKHYKIILTTCAVVAAAILTSMQIKKPVLGYVDYVKDEESDLTEAANFIKENDINDHLYNHYNIGANLILLDVKTYVDTRCDPFIKEFSGSTSLADFFDITTGTNKENKPVAVLWDELKEKYGFKYGLFDKEISLDREVAYSLKLRGYKILFENKGYTIISVEEQE